MTRAARRAAWFVLLTIAGFFCFVFGMLVILTAEVNRELPP